MKAQATSPGRVHLGDIVPAPWRNGGGSTRELLRWPQRPPGPRPHETGGEDWALRVSVAEIDRDGPFSPYPGIERWFAVLEGAGVWLALPGGERRLIRGDAPLHFTGEQAPGCRLAQGPTRDLNLMVRRRAGVGRMELARLGEPTEPIEASGTLWRALYAATALRVQAGDGAPEALESGTLLWSGAHEGGPWRVLDAGLAFWMSMSR